MELVSAIITTYKRPPEIVERAINSVLRQTYSPIEIIVVDDSPCSFKLRNDIADICIKLRNKVKYIQHEKNKGACAARNTGVQAASGKYIAFLDDDDEWLPEKIEKQLSVFKNNDIGLVYCGNRLVNDENSVVSVPNRRYVSGYVYDKLIFENFIGSTSFPLLDKRCFESVGGFDPLMESAQDYDVWLRIAERFKVAYVAEPLVDYHIINTERISTNHQKRINGQKRLIEKNYPYLVKNKKALWHRKLRLLINYSLNRQLLVALKEWMEAVKVYPFSIFVNIKYLGIAIVYYWRSCSKGKS